jgi:hypothetical protein
MASIDIAVQRMRSSRLTGNPLPAATDVVRWLCAVQAQDYAGVKWAIAQRTAAVSDAELDRLFNEGAILRTHVLRPTWHVVLPADIRWLLRLTAPRVKAAVAYYDRVLGLDNAAFTRGNVAIGRALQAGGALTRTEIGEVLRRSGLDIDNQRLGHLLMRAELDGVVCSGGLRGRQLTYALLDERAPEAPALDGDAALAELATRYFAGHAPAQVRDFAWWSGLSLRQARTGIEMATPHLDRVMLEGVPHYSAEAAETPRRGRPLVHLLPNWDEYVVGYADRSAHVTAAAFPAPPTSMALLANSVVINGRIVGGWRRTVARDGVVVRTTLKVDITPAQRTGLERACQRYSRFLDRPVELLTG